MVADFTTAEFRLAFRPTVLSLSIAVWCTYLGLDPHQGRLTCVCAGLLLLCLRLLLRGLHDPPYAPLVFGRVWAVLHLFSFAIVLNGTLCQRGAQLYEDAPAAFTPAVLTASLVFLNAFAGQLLGGSPGCKLLIQLAPASVALAAPESVMSGSLGFLSVCAAALGRAVGRLAMHTARKRIISVPVEKRPPSPHTMRLNALLAPIDPVGDARVSEESIEADPETHPSCDGTLRGSDEECNPGALTQPGEPQRPTHLSGGAGGSCQSLFSLYDSQADPQASCWGLNCFPFAAAAPGATNAPSPFPMVPPAACDPSPPGLCSPFPSAEARTASLEPATLPSPVITAAVATPAAPPSPVPPPHLSPPPPPPLAPVTAAAFDSAPAPAISAAPQSATAAARRPRPPALDNSALGTLASAPPSAPPSAAPAVCAPPASRPRPPALGESALNVLGKCGGGIEARAPRTASRAPFPTATHLPACDAARKRRGEPLPTWAEAPSPFPMAASTQLPACAPTLPSPFGAPRTNGKLQLRPSTAVAGTAAAAAAAAAGGCAPPRTKQQPFPSPMFASPASVKPATTVPGVAAGGGFYGVASPWLGDMSQPGGAREPLRPSDVQPFSSPPAMLSSSLLAARAASGASGCVSGAAAVDVFRVGGGPQSQCSRRSAWSGTTQPAAHTINDDASSDSRGSSSADTLLRRGSFKRRGGKASRAGSALSRRERAEAMTVMPACRNPFTLGAPPPPRRPQPSRELTTAAADANDADDAVDEASGDVPQIRIPATLERDRRRLLRSHLFCPAFTDSLFEADFRAAHFRNSFLQHQGWLILGTSMFACLVQGGAIWAVLLTLPTSVFLLILHRMSDVHTAAHWGSRGCALIILGGMCLLLYRGSAPWDHASLTAYVFSQFFICGAFHVFVIELRIRAGLVAFSLLVQICLSAPPDERVHRNLVVVRTNTLVSTAIFVFEHVVVWLVAQDVERSARLRYCAQLNSGLRTLLPRSHRRLDVGATCTASEICRNGDRNGVAADADTAGDRHSDRNGVTADAANGALTFKKRPPPLSAAASKPQPRPFAQPERERYRMDSITLQCSNPAVERRLRQYLFHADFGFHQGALAVGLSSFALCLLGLEDKGSIKFRGLVCAYAVQFGRLLIHQVKCRKRALWLASRLFITLQMLLALCVHAICLRHCHWFPTDDDWSLVTAVLACTYSPCMWSTVPFWWWRLTLLAHFLVSFICLPFIIALVGASPSWCGLGIEFGSPASARWMFTGLAVGTLVAYIRESDLRSAYLEYLVERDVKSAASRASSQQAAASDQLLMSRAFDEKTLSRTLLRNRIPLDELRFEALLGQGTFGQVRTAYWKDWPCAAKSMHTNRTTSHDLQVAKRAAETHLNLKPHTNIVAMHGLAWSIESATLVLVMELCEGGTLDSALKRRTLNWNEHRLPIAVDVSRGLSFLHAQSPPVMHRDLKPDNILLDGKGCAKIADFGLSRKIGQKQTMTDGVGSMMFCAPELLNATQYDETADVWSLGCVLVCLSRMCSEPYSTGTGNFGFRPSAVAAGELLPSVERSCALQAIISRCCTWDVRKRCQAREVLTELENLIARNTPPSS